MRQNRIEFIVYINYTQTTIFANYLRDNLEMNRYKMNNSKQIFSFEC